MAAIAHGSLPVPRRRWASRAALDRLLLAGADPDGSPALRRRARKLASPRRRESLACGLENAVVAARRPRASLSSVVPVRRAEVRATEHLMLELAARIRATNGRHPAGLILARRLLTSGAGPLFAPSAPGALRDALTDAMVALSDVRPHSL
jgi:hypothetical protein